MQNRYNRVPEQIREVSWRNGFFIIFPIVLGIALSVSFGTTCLHMGSNQLNHIMCVMMSILIFLIFGLMGVLTAVIISLVRIIGTVEITKN